MLELHILRYLMIEEGRSYLSSGKLQGISVSSLQKAYDIPKSTFYRAVNELLAQDFIVKSKRGHYKLSTKYRTLCNEQKDSLKVS